MLISVTPADGANGVGSTAPLVFVFDQDMDTTVVSVPSSTGFTGNFSIVPSNLNMFGTWGADKRTLTIKPALTVPLNITVQWTLNPAGGFDFLFYKSATGVRLATVSGSYSTDLASVVPKLGSSGPADGATAVPTNSTITLKFDQPMKQKAGIGGAIHWTGDRLDPSKFIYAWTADSRQLGCTYSGGLPTNSLVTWALNPPGAAVTFESQTGNQLASSTYSGQFTTGGKICDPGPTAFWGSYGIAKRSNFRQISSADPVEDIEPGTFVFFAVIANPAFGGATYTSGSVTFPNGSQTNLANFANLSFFESVETEAELDAASPPGAYTLRFAQTGQTEFVIPMTLPVNGPPVPRITNFAATQAVNAAQDFTLEWVTFTGADADDFIFINIFDEQFKVVFHAPDGCLPINPPATATSIVIPANTFKTNQTCSVELVFGQSFYSSTNTVSLMSGYGNILRGNRFNLKTGTGGGGAALPATLGEAHLLGNGHPAFDLGGTAGATYAIQRVASLEASTWPEIGTVTMDGTGQAVFEDTQAGSAFPQFYRAVAK